MLRLVWGLFNLMLETLGLENCMISLKNIILIFVPQRILL